MITVMKNKKVTFIVYYVLSTKLNQYQNKSYLIKKKMLISLMVFLTENPKALFI